MTGQEIIDQVNSLLEEGLTGGQAPCEADQHLCYQRG